MTISYILLATTAVHAIFVLYNSFKFEKDDSRGAQIISGSLLLAAVAGVFILPQYSGFLVGLGWFIFLLIPSYMNTEQRIAIRKGEWQKAAVWSRRINRLLPSARLIDYADMYDILHHLTHDNMTPALAILETRRPSTPSLQEWFRWQSAILRRNFDKVLAESGRPDIHLAKPNVLDFRLLAHALQNDLPAYLDAFQSSQEDFSKFPASFQAKGYVYLFAIIGRPDLIQQIKATNETAATPANWLLWRGIAQYNAGERETAEQTFHELTQIGDDLQRQYHRQQYEALLASPRPTPTADQQQQIASILAAWEEKHSTP
jgi:hypothetical protein